MFVYNFMYSIIVWFIKLIRPIYYYLFPTKKNIIISFTLYHSNGKDIIQFRKTKLKNKNLKIIDIMNWCMLYKPYPNKVAINYKSFSYSNDILIIYLDIPKNTNPYIYNNRFFSNESEIPFDDAALEYDNYKLEGKNINKISTELKFIEMKQSEF